MSERKQHIDEVFKRGLADHKSAPPPEVWGGINAHLSGKRRRSLFLYVAGIAAAVLLLMGSGGIMYYFMQGNTRDNYLSPGNIATHPAGEEIHEPGLLPLTVDNGENNIILPLAEAAAWPDESTALVENNSARLGQKNSEEFFILAQHDIAETGIQYSDVAVNQELPPLSLKSAMTANLYMNIKPYLVTMPVGPDKIRPDKTGPPSVNTVTDGRERQNRWTASVMIAPNYSYRTLSSINSGSFSKEHFNSFESGLMSVSGSVNINYRISNRFSVQSGVDLQRMGQIIHRMKIFSDFINKDAISSGSLTNIVYSKASFSNSFGSIEPSYSSQQNSSRASNFYKLSAGQESQYQLSHHETEDIIQGLYYMQTPVLLKYQLLNGKTGVTVSGGPGINLLIGNRVILRQEGNNMNIGHTRDINRISVSGIVAVGMERRLSNKIRLLLEPRFSHFISPVNSSGSLLSLPYSFSVFGGISYGF